MTKRLLIGCAVALSVACGGGDDGAEPEASDPATSGDEATVDDDGSDGVAAGDPADEAEPEEEDDGMLCLPVSRCHSFANQDCTLVDQSGAIQDEELSGGSVEEACPGERGVADGVTECFSYVEMSESCRRRPELRQPEWPCGRTDSARCDIVM